MVTGMNACALLDLLAINLIEGVNQELRYQE